MEYMSFQTLFQLAMKRPLMEITSKSGLVFDIGASGRWSVPGAIAMGAPKWVWPRDLIPAEPGTVDAVHAYHFMEHLTGEDAILFLQEVQRVLKPGGALYFCVPYYNSGLMAQDLTHKSAWNEETFRNLFNNTSYDPLAGTGFDWKLMVNFQIIAGIVERNISLIGQLVKTHD